MFRRTQENIPQGKLENKASAMELFKKDPKGFVEGLRRKLPTDNDVIGELWKLLIEVGVSPMDRSPENRIYSSYDSEYLVELLKTRIEPESTQKAA